MKRREFSSGLLASLLSLCAVPSSAKAVIRTGGRDLVRASSLSQSGQFPRAAVLGLGGNGSAAACELRQRFECGEFCLSSHLKTFEAFKATVEPDLILMGRHGQVPRALLRPMADQSWLEQDLRNVDLLIVLGNLKCHETRKYLPGFLIEAARLGISTLVGVIEPWEVIDGEVRRPNSSAMREYIASVRNWADTLIVVQEDFAKEVILRWSALKDGDLIDDAMHSALSTWNIAGIEKLAEIGHTALAMNAFQDYSLGGQQGHSNA